PPPLAPGPGFGTVAPADGTPMSWALQLTSAPPLLPGLIAASVCSADTSSAVWPLSPGTSMVRSSALTIPEVTVFDSPSGAPSATTGWPTTTSLEEPNGITGSDGCPSTLMTARSAFGSRPVMVAGVVWPSLNSTSTCPPSAAMETTWLLVRMYPLLRMTSPDPVPPVSPLVAVIVTTDGRLLLATSVAEQTLALAGCGFAENSFLAGGDVTWQAQSLARKRAKGTTMADTSDIRQRLTDEVRMLLPELLEASTNYRAAKARYRRRREVFAGSVNQDIEVSQDRLAKKAIADCNWYGSETERL